MAPVPKAFDINTLFPTIPHPHTPDWEAESALILRFLHTSWRLILTVLLSIIGLIFSLILIIRVIRAYDRWCEEAGGTGLGLGISQREERLVNACVVKGRGVRARMEVDRLQRLVREAERRDKFRAEALRERGKASKVKPTITEKPILATPFPDLALSASARRRSSSRPRAPLERRPTKRNSRRRTSDGTQYRSESSASRPSLMASRMPRGTEAKIGMLWRRDSRRSVHANSEPEHYWGVGTFKNMRAHSSEHTQPADEEVETSVTESGRSRVERSSGTEMRDFAIAVLADAGIEGGDMGRFSFEVGGEAVNQVVTREGGEVGTNERERDKEHK